MGNWLSPEDLIQLEEQMIVEDEGAETPESKRFHSMELADAFIQTEEGMEKFEAQDPNSSRYSKVYRAVMGGLTCYREI